MYEKNLFLFAVLLPVMGCGAANGGQGFLQPIYYLLLSGTQPLPAPTTVIGTAAAGAPIVGTVNIRGANSVISTSAIRADGSYTVDVAALTTPFLIWAEGTANGQTVRLYSTVQAAGKVANVTPATNLVMAMALGADPAVVYGAYGATSAPTADLPGAGDIITAADVNALLASVFASLDMPANFNLMNGSFVADGSKFDSILDTVSFQVNSSDPANVTVTIADKASATTPYNDNVSTDTDTPTELTAAEAAKIVAYGLSFQQQALTVMKKVETLYAISAPTLKTLQTEFQPYMTADFLDNGRNATDALYEWSTSGEGPSIGLKIVAINIYRAMGEQPMADGTKLSEMPGHSEGYWCMLTVEEGGRQQSMLTSFVKDADGVYKWYGDRNPFEDGGNVSSRHMHAVFSDGTSTMWSGLNVYTEDRGNFAKDIYGIDVFVVLHPTLPDMTNVGLSGVHGLLLVNDPATPDTRFPIVSVTPAHGEGVFTEADGLDVANLKAGDEFIFVGAAMDGTPKNVWIGRLGSVPLTAANLTAGHFATITAPTSLSNVTIPRSVTVSWSMPTAPTAQTAFGSWCHITWDNGMDWTDMHSNNPVWSKEWTSTTFDTSATTVFSAINFFVDLSVETIDGTEFSTQVSFQ